MKSTFTTQAIILNRKEYGENDLKVDVLTRDKGRLSLVARGAKKMRSKLAAHLEPFTISDIMVVKGRKMDYIGGAVGREFFLDLKNDLTKLYYAGAAAKIFLEQIKEKEEVDSDPYFTLLRDFWSILEKGVEVDNKKGELWYAFFLLRFLRIYGLSPQLYHCVFCGSEIVPGNNIFELQEGGAACPACHQQTSRDHSFKISDDCIKIVKLMLTAELREGVRIKATEEKLSREVASIVNKFYMYNF